MTYEEVLKAVKDNKIVETRYCRDCIDCWYQIYSDGDGILRFEDDGKPVFIAASREFRLKEKEEKWIEVSQKEAAEVSAKG